MRGHLTSAALLGTALALGACTSENSTFLTGFTQPAGAFLDEGQFGNATMINMQAQKACANKPKGYIVPDPVVVLDPDEYLDPKSPQPEVYTTPRYGYARCSGTLNGKYAEVIFEEYVESATELPPEKQSTSTSVVVPTGG
ncbi:hypothetical protein [Oceaniglobus roseus]|uniref:hypothetical protein n=1 Tax=Oceaniglobus roseus TaxID=1737570 RepID=UPI0012FFF4CD|nr:hypothetical protein [Kandeliimicrobium roseum]